MAELNAKLLASDGDRDPNTLADRLEALAAEFLTAPAPDEVDWLQGLRMPASAVAGHLLEECLMHGHDLASATGRPWPIRHDHALLAIEAGVLPLIEAMPPAAFVNQDKDFRARVEVRPRGGTTRVLDFADRRLTLHQAGMPNIDAHLSIDPVALMLVFIGRQPIWKPLLTGQVAAWGWRPWKLVQMLTAIEAP